MRASNLKRSTDEVGERGDASAKYGAAFDGGENSPSYSPLLCMLGNKRGKKMTCRALVSFLWQPGDYYHTWRVIMKGLPLMGSETVGGEGRTVHARERNE